MYCLRCSDTDDSVFDVVPSDEPITGFREQGCYLFVLNHTSLCSLVIDDVALERVPDPDAQKWVWEPGFYAGTVTAELFDQQGTRLANYRLDVTPAPDKLGQAVFKQILDDLLISDPRLLFGAEAAQSAIGTEGDYSNPHLEYGRIKMFGPLLLQAIRNLCNRPLSTLRGTRQLVHSHQVRRFDQHSTRTLARSPHILAALYGADGSTASPERLLFDVPRSIEELDTPAHRTLLSLMLAVVRRVRKVRSELEYLSGRERNAAARTRIAPRLNYRRKLLDELERTLHRQCRAVPFASVRRSEVSAAGLNAIAGHPLYATAYQYGWQILRPGIDGQSEKEMLSMSPTWEIYERWCFLRLAEILRHLFPTLSWRRRFGKKVGRIVDIGTSNGVTIEVHLQKTFTAMDKKNDSTCFYSISGERRPDIIVVYKGEGHQRFIVFDPKYRVARSNILEAMEAAHIYRDCLRWRGRPPDLALLLIPALGKASWLEDPSFHSEHRVGVLPFSPETDHEKLHTLLQEVLS